MGTLEAGEWLTRSLTEGMLLVDEIRLDPFIAADRLGKRIVEDEEVMGYSVMLDSSRLG
jgi:hypothetical protein